MSERDGEPNAHSGLRTPDSGLRRPRVAFLTPLPPVKSGIATYSAMILPELAKELDLTVVVDQPRVDFDDAVPTMQFADFRKRVDEFDSVICQLGNNPHHETFYCFALEHPCIVVLHDVVLHHLIVEMTLARGLDDAYVDALRENHGEPGAAWARARAAGMHDEIGNFFFPASRELVRRSEAVMVHSDYARSIVESYGLETPIVRVNHPYVPSSVSPGEKRDEYRARSGMVKGDIVVGMFGFVTSAKRPEVVIEAFARAWREEPRLKLLIVGEPSPNIDLARLTSAHGLPPNAWRATGYVSDEEFDFYLAAVDKVVNLRYPSAGETSGALFHIVAAEKPVAVSDYGSFADVPPGVVTKIPLDQSEVERLTTFILGGDVHDAPLQREWLAREGSLSRSIATYAATARGEYQPSRHAEPRPQALIPLFPQWKVQQTIVQPGVVTFDLVNTSGDVILNPSYLTPAYRIVAKFFDGAREISSSWIAPTCDILPRDTFTCSVARVSAATAVELHHALESIPPVGSARFARLELVS